MKDLKQFGFYNDQSLDYNALKSSKNHYATISYFENVENKRKNNLKQFLTSDFEHRIQNINKINERIKTTLDNFTLKDISI